jgi:hypothetical protein
MKAMAGKKALDPSAACCDIRPARAGKLQGTVLHALNSVFSRDL